MDPMTSRVRLRREFIADGLTDNHIRSMVKRRELARIRHGAYAPAGWWAGLDEEQRHRTVARAVLRAQHPDTVLTHVSAALEHGAPVWGFDLSRIHVTRSDGRVGRSDAGVVQHRSPLLPEDLLQSHSVPVTSRLRTAFEVMSLGRLEPALVTVNGLLRDGKLSAEDLHKAAPRYSAWPRTLHANLLTHLVNPVLESVGESRYWYLSWRHHLPLPVPQFRVQDASTGFTAFLDFGYPEHEAFVEFDGRSKYLRFRREGESIEQFLMREKRREEMVSQLLGWRCIRVSWQDLSQGAATAERIRRVLDGSRRVA